VEVVPDDILKGPDGHLVRNIRTGHFRKSDPEKLAARTLVLAARGVFPGATVQILHLADGTVTEVVPKRGQDAKDRTKIAEVIGGVRSGEFRAKPSPRVCPGCPAFFICDAVPDGGLLRKF
jgi:hypothetical protein